MNIYIIEYEGVEYAYSNAVIDAEGYVVDPENKRVDFWKTEDDGKARAFATFFRPVTVKQLGSNYVGTQPASEEDI